MKPLTVSRFVAAPPERVFALASDFAGAADRVGAILRVEMLTPGPVKVGTRFKETRRMFGREATETMEVTTFEPPRRYVLEAEGCGCRYESGIQCDPSDGGTRLTFTFQAEPLTLFGKVMGALMSPMVKKMIAECAKDLDDIARAAERPAA